MKFKDILKKDVNLFLNINEFGEKINIGNTEFLGVLVKENKKFSETEIYSEGDNVTIYLEAREELKKYNPGKSIEINKELYLIDNCYEESGMFIFKLTTRKGY